MSFFNPNLPILRRKQVCSDLKARQEMRCIDLNIGDKTPFSGIYTCIDQVFILWGLIEGIIFISAQFLPISWVNQAIIWSILSLVGTIAMFILTYSWVKLEGLRWLLFTWSGLMLLGILVTDLGVFYGWGIVLINLCNLWLIISAVGYLVTGWGMRSRAFFLATAIHLVAICFLPLVWRWQFLATGLVMMSNLFLFAEHQWDMLLPKDQKKQVTVKPTQKVKLHHQILSSLT
jgi:hypothetical protein